MLRLFPQESTYGTHIHEKREEREARFCNTVHDIVNREGRCLIPVFALGRAQELLLILGEKHALQVLLSGGSLITVLDESFLTLS
jgi:Cft2 family RNA processing exonuclease